MIDSQYLTLNFTNFRDVKIPLTLRGNTLSVNGASMVFLNLPITKIDGSASFSGDSIKLTGAAVATGGGTITLGGSVAPALDLKLSIDHVQLSDISPIVPGIEAYDARGLVRAGLTVKGAYDNPAVNGTVDFSNGSFMGIPLAFSTTAQMENLKLTLSPLTIRALDVPISGMVSADMNGKTPVLDMNLKTGGALAAGTVRKYLPLLPAAVDGQLDSLELSAKGPADALKGSAQLRAAQLVYNGQSLTDADIKADFDITSSVTVSGTVSAAGAPTELKGTLNFGSEDVTADAEFSTRGFDLAVLKKLFPDFLPDLSGKVSAALKAGLSGDTVTADVKLNSEHISLDGMNIDSVNFPAAFDGKTLTISGASLNLMGLPLTKINISAAFDDNGLTLDEGSLETAGGTLNLSGVLMPSLDLKASAQKIQIADLAVIVDIFLIFIADVLLEPLHLLILQYDPALQFRNDLVALPDVLLKSGDLLAALLLLMADIVQHFVLVKSTESLLEH